MASYRAKTVSNSCARMQRELDAMHFGIKTILVSLHGSDVRLHKQARWLAACDAINGASAQLELAMQELKDLGSI